MEGNRQQALTSKQCMHQNLVLGFKPLTSGIGDKYPELAISVFARICIMGFVEGNRQQALTSKRCMHQNIVMGLKPPLHFEKRYHIEGG